MATSTKRSDYFNSVEGQAMRQKLQFMTADTTYNTSASYTVASPEHPDGLLSFVDKHMNYLNVHPKVDAVMYVANLRMMTRRRS